MNQGVEDAGVFSELARTYRLSEHKARRRHVVGRAVRRVEPLSKFAAAET